MSFQVFHLAVFGPLSTGLGTVGFRLYNADGTPNGGRITSGVLERAPGSYAALITLPDAFTGEIRWDTGGGSPIFASALVNPDDEPGYELDAIAARIIADHGMGSYVWAGGVGSGTGAYLVSVTVKDSGTLTALQNVRVRVTDGINEFISTTDVAGVALFSLDAATYELMMSKEGYEFRPVSIVVAASANFDETMLQVSVAIDLAGNRLEV